jgi:puromycin-sensitive aminopeptidase
VSRDSDHRLPRSVVPRRYALRLAPDLDAATFTGDEEVGLELTEPTGEIVLNALDLEIDKVELGDEHGTTIAGEPSLDASTGRLTVALESVAAAGSWTLRASFSGVLNDKLRGFYRSTFSDGEHERVIATTQFEPTDARRAFPCWDEPDRKAVFSVSIDVDAGLSAVSNTGVVAEEDLGGGRRRIRFADTIPMSTYLVAFVVGPLEVTDALDVDGVALRVVHVPGKSALTSFALEVAEHGLRFFSEWFGIAYPGDKLDLIALPDFAAGAMENLGAVTFRESVLLIDPASASRLELERVADVISHELAHMWFGDLVTMRWWNGLWLNEAFATFMELLCVDHYKPEWKRWVSFGRSRAAAMVTDGLSSTRPIEFPVGRPEEAEGMFDILTYEKGAGVLRMLERYLDAEPFRRGIRRYLEAHLYDNAETTDLWDSIEEATGEPARATMDSWIFQGGHPLVTVSTAADGLVLDQQPFRYRPAASEEADNIGRDWQVPVLLRTGAERSVAHHRVLLGPDPETLRLGVPPEWVVVNSGGSGFYRVRYSGDLLARLLDDLSRLDALERFNLVSDTWAAVLAGLAPLSDFVALTAVLGDEPDANVWAVVTSALVLLDRVVDDGDRPVLQAFTRRLLQAPFERVGWEPRPKEEETTGTLRATLIDALGTIGADPEVVARAGRLHDESIAGRAGLDPDLAGAVVSVVASSSGAREFEAFLERYRHPSTPQEELRYLYGLAGFRDPGLVSRALDLALDEVRTQNAPFLIGLLLANRVGGRVAWEFVKSRWDDLLARFPDNTIPRMLEGASTLLAPDSAADVRDFCSSHPLRSGQRTVEQILERLEINLAFAGRQRPGLAAALA